MTHRGLLPMVLLLLASGIARSGDGRIGNYSFTFNGKPLTPTVISLSGTPEAPQPGDVIQTYVGGGFALVLGAPGTYAFEVDETEGKRSDGRLYRRDPETQKKILIAVRVSGTFEGDDWVVADPLASLSADELKQLRGVTLDSWTEAIPKQLPQIDPKLTCVAITDSTAQGKARTMPPLPAGLHYLIVDESSSKGIKDFSDLARQRELRLLEFSSMSGEDLDVKLIAANAELRYLDLSGNPLQHPEAMKSLAALRVLRLDYCRNLGSIACLGEMTQLRKLEIRGTAVNDLTPLGKLQALQTVSANNAPVAALPEAKMPGLLELDVMSTELDAETVAEFVKRNPGCRVRHRWDAALRNALAKVSRIRVRSGGTCHRSPEEEKTLFEIDKAEDIRAFIKMIAIDEGRSGFHCLCCGSPSIEFYVDRELLATLGFHHGRSLRWPGGWPGDALLTDEAADAVCKWFDDHGVKRPLQEREEEEVREQAARRRQNAYLKIIPEAVVTGLRDRTRKTSVQEAFEQEIKDGSRRAEYYLALFGCDHGSWNHSSGLDEMLTEVLLPGVAKEDLQKALSRIKPDSQAAAGAARWLFGNGKWTILDPKLLEQVIAALAPAALAHPRPINRSRTMQALAEIKSPPAIKQLKAVLAGEIKIRPLPVAEAAEPGGMVEFRGRDALISDQCSDRGVAAQCLIKSGDADGGKLAREYLKTAPPAEVKVVEESLKEEQDDE